MNDISQGDMNNISPSGLKITYLSSTQGLFERHFQRNAFVLRIFWNAHLKHYNNTIEVRTYAVGFLTGIFKLQSD